MQGTPEDRTAQIVPVGVGVNQVKVPGLIDRVARGDRVARTDGEVEEAAILGDHQPGERERPAVLAREPLREGQGGPGRIERERLQPAQEGVVVGVHARYRRPGAGAWVADRKSVV